MKKTLGELTIKDNFVFGAVMCEEDNCRKFLEMVLDFPIERVEVNKEKSIVYHPEYKGVRLDVYAKDEKNTHYNVEMQAIKEPALGKRARYYHSHIDMELLLSGEEYSKLSDTYVIFVCDFDPFMRGKYCYTFENLCTEDKELSIQDGAKTIFLNTRGKNKDEVPTEMIAFLEFVKADLKNSTKDFHDDFVRQLQESVQKVKSSRKMEENFMILREMLRDERAEGKAEGKAESVIELLGEIGPVSDELREKIINEKDMSVLLKWLKLAAKSESVQKFEENM
ncbi:MAG: Rpn family recombination-promoting nuclease/putative transposase [Lachnospiraceae bacterium]|nr:Rpn family recombination-promoting nuclease/putative transposase [Lachnospiraceae bacterium]